MNLDERLVREGLGGLDEDDRASLREGRHAELALSLRLRGRLQASGRVLEQIWDWDGACEAYLDAGLLLDALRVALESGVSRLIDRALRRIEAARPEVIDAAAALLQKRRRPMEAARLMASSSDPRLRANALLEAGDRLGAARAFADAGDLQAALTVLTADGRTPSPAGLLFAARVAWDLGDAEGAARFAQRAQEAGERSDELSALLARALVALGHDLAAQIVLRERHLDVPSARRTHGSASHERETHNGTADTEEAPRAPSPWTNAHERGVPGRYHVTALGPTGLIGAAYFGIDRVTLEEVEIHLLLADQTDAAPTPPDVLAALDRFAVVAESGSRLPHPSVRPVLRLDADAGLLVLPRAHGPSLRSLIRPPGMLAMPSRARGMIAFLLEGLEQAHARGLVHGWLLPGQIALDAVGRPLLPPFGAYHLSGLAATRTGSLEELMFVTAPELRRGGTPTVASDLYAIGALLRALLVGRLGMFPQGEDDSLPPLPELALTDALMAPEPAERPELAATLALLRAPVADVRELERRERQEHAGVTGRDLEGSEWGAGLAVVAAPSWTDLALDALCRSAHPWLQPILDRGDRRIVLAPWPEGSLALDDSVTGYLDLLDPDALAFEDPVLEEAVRSRVLARTLVRVPSGVWMLALDDLLTR